MKSLVSIAIHTGSLKYVYLLQNLIKSFLICNHYKQIELILIETGKENKIRKWFKKLNFNGNFINFDGTETNIKKHYKCKINKKLLFMNFPKTKPWYSCYMQGIKKASKIAKGKYLICLSEDYQFFVKGNLISEYIKINNLLGKKKSILTFYHFTKYRILKKNNELKKKSSYFGKLKFKKFKFNKGDLFSFVSKDISKKYFDFPESNFSKPHGTIEYFNHLTEKKKINRYYPLLSPCLHFANNDREYFSKLIRKNTKIDKNYLLYKPTKLFEILDLIKEKNIKHPISLEDFKFLRETTFLQEIYFYASKIAKKII